MSIFVYYILSANSMGRHLILAICSRHVLSLYLTTEISFFSSRMCFFQILSLNKEIRSLSTKPFVCFSILWLERCHSHMQSSEFLFSTFLEDDIFSIILAIGVLIWSFYHECVYECFSYFATIFKVIEQYYVNGKRSLYTVYCLSFTKTDSLYG